MRRFYKDLKVGKIWEEQFLSWMSKRFESSSWVITDTSDVFRDADGDQFPDYKLVSERHNKTCFVDAKKRCVYKHRGHKLSFGFDQNYFNSYTNIAAKNGAKVYAAFNDPSFDKNHVYILDMDLPPDFIHDYGSNGFGEPICYRWYVDSLTKFEL